MCIRDRFYTGRVLIRTFVFPRPLISASVLFPLVVLISTAAAAVSYTHLAALLAEVFKEHRPDVIYHAAAFKHVPMMEVNPLAAIRNNVCLLYTSTAGR